MVQLGETIVFTSSKNRYKDSDKKDLDDTDLDNEVEAAPEIDALDLDDAEDTHETRTLLTPASGATPLDLARLGLSEIAYIRRAIVNDMPMWTIHSAAGDPLGAAHSFDQAWAAVKQNDMEPVRVH